MFSSIQPTLELSGASTLKWHLNEEEYYLKGCLKSRAKLSYDELLTALTEVEMILNSRFLSYISPDDLEDPLTPAHFLMGRQVMSAAFVVEKLTMM